MSPLQPASGAEGRGGVFQPMPWRSLWRVLNAPRDIDASAMRAACLGLLVFYVGSALLRPAHDPAITWIRLAVCAYIAFGALLAARVTWTALRAYTVGLALIIPISTAAIALLRGGQSGDLALLALALFGPAVFLQTAADVAALVVGLGLAAGAFIAAFPPAGVPAGAAGIVVTGALVAGAITALVLIAFRARVSESTRWWQEACARERALREFGEQAPPGACQAARPGGG